MPTYYPAELRRRTCERMLAGDAVKDLVAELETRRSPSIGGGTYCLPRSDCDGR